MRTLNAVCVGMLLGFSAMLNAAEVAPEVAADEDQTAEEMLAAEAALEQREAQAAQISEAPASEATDPGMTTAPANAASGSADEDFVPSIQISEDLSVSFPVDI